MVDKLALYVLEAVQTSDETCLPLPSSGRQGGHTQHTPVPGWKDTVRPFRDTAFFWHQVWISCGKPLNTEVHKVMKRTRNVYHYHFNKCRKSEEKIRKNKLLEACLGQGDNSIDLFKESKTLRKS